MDTKQLSKVISVKYNSSDDLIYLTWEHKSSGNNTEIMKMTTFYELLKFMEEELNKDD